jgi:hypothetical protein
MAFRKMPPADVMPLTEGGQWSPDYFDFFLGIDDLDPLSAVVFPSDDAKSNVVRTIDAQIGTTYTFALADAGNLCEFTNAAAITVTIPLNATVAFPIGTQIDVVQGGAGKVTFAGAGGVTLKSVGSLKSLSTQEAGGTLIKMATDTWRLVGSLIA